MLRLAARTATAAVFVMVVSSCAGNPAIPPGTVFISAAEHARLQQAAKDADDSLKRIAAMEARLSGIRGKMETLMTRAALTPYSAKRLVPMPGGAAAASLGDALWIGVRGERPKKKSLSKLVRNSQSTIFSFWATWCVPCISDEELAHMADLKRQLARFNVNVVHMAIDNLDKVLTHPKAGKWLYPLWFMKGGHIELMPQEFIERSGMGLPLFAVVDSAGLIRYVYQKKLDDSLVNELVDASLSL